MADRLREAEGSIPRGDPRHPGKPCRACMDFKQWIDSGPPEFKASAKAEAKAKEAKVEKSHECPLDKNELGRNTWSFLHTMAAYFPEKPSINQQTDMKNLIFSFSKFYPCEYCAADMREDLKGNPPVTTSQKDLSLWFCNYHNKVNEKLGKQTFDCSKVDQRWRDGWKDGSCDI